MVFGYVFRLHFIGSEHEERGDDYGTLATSQEEALEQIIDQLGDDWHSCYMSSISVFPLRKAEVTKWRYEKGKGMQGETFSAYAAVGGGHLMYVDSSEESIPFVAPCKATFGTKIKCQIYKNNHDVKFVA
jgi:hypothetical protein